MKLYQPNVSVIIPYYGDSIQQLSECILAIEKQTYLKDKIEVLVIDNNVSPKIISQFATNKSVKIFHEPKIGSYSARNKGIEVSTGEILAFTDSDCLPDKNWLENGLLALNNTGFNVVGGAILFTFRKMAKPNIFELIDSTIHLRQIDYVKNMNYAATANLLTHRSLFFKYGKFDSNYFSGGDREWGERLKGNGVSIIYSSETIVFHPARTTLRSLINKNRRAVGGEIIRSKKLAYSKCKIFQMQKEAFWKRSGLLELNSNMTGNELFLSKIILVIIYLVRFVEVARLLLGGRMVR